MHKTKGEPVPVAGVNEKDVFRPKTRELGDKHEGHTEDGQRDMILHLHACGYERERIAERLLGYYLTDEYVAATSVGNRGSVAVSLSTQNRLARQRRMLERIDEVLDETD